MTEITKVQVDNICNIIIKDNFQNNQELKENIVFDFT